LQLAAPAGSIHMTVGDAAKWLSFHLNGGSFVNSTGQSQQLVSQQSLQETYGPITAINLLNYFTKPFFPASFQMTSYAMGWFNIVYRDHVILGHGGNVFGQSSFFMWLPYEQFGVLFLTNMNSQGPALEMMGMYAIDLAFGDEPWISPETACDFPCKWMNCTPPNPGSTPIFPPAADIDLQEYVGLYLHPTYGQVNVTLEGQKSFLQLWKRCRYWFAHSAVSGCLRRGFPVCPSSRSVGYTGAIWSQHVRRCGFFSCST